MIIIPCNLCKNIKWKFHVRYEADTHTRTYTHTHIHTHIHTHAHTYTHTHTPRWAAWSHELSGCGCERAGGCWRPRTSARRGTHKCQKRPTNVKRDRQMSKETYSGRKRDLLWKEKRPTNVKRDPQCQKRPTNVKRDLLWKEKRPTMKGKETYYERQKE